MLQGKVRRKALFGGWFSSSLYSRAAVGFVGALKLRVIRQYNRVSSRARLPGFWPLVKLRLREYGVRLFLRTGSSDYQVLEQIFIEREYRPLDDLQRVRSIVDCGANVGYSSVYFLKLFPEARVIAVEPDPSNVAICRRNLAPFKERATIIQSAVWSHPAGLSLTRAVHGQEWAIQVNELESDGNAALGDVAATDVPALLSRCEGGRADILKVDIERSERVVFRDAAKWLHRVGNIAIELHDSECEAVFLQALRDFDYEMLRSGELTICRNIRARRVAPEAGTASTMQDVGVTT